MWHFFIIIIIIIPQLVCKQLYENGHSTSRQLPLHQAGSIFMRFYEPNPVYTSLSCS